MECGRQRSKVKTLLLHHCALRKFHVRDSQNTRDQIASDRRSKRAWSKCVLCIPFILNGSPNGCWLHKCDACVITTWRLGLRAPLVALNYIHKFQSEEDLCTTVSLVLNLNSGIFSPLEYKYFTLGRGLIALNK